jgi:tetratricopeptide (TPR) repeat protein
MATKKPTPNGKAKSTKSAAKPNNATPPSSKPKGLSAMRHLQQVLSQQEFGSVTEVEAFLTDMESDDIPEFEPTKEEQQAEELVMQGYDAPVPQAVELARRALELDHECISAFDLLGRCETMLAICAAYFKRGMDLGEERFDNDYRVRNEGHYWGLNETRPYLRCMAGYADCCFYLGDVYQAMDVWEDMLYLNSADNLGIRHHQLLCMAALGEEDEFKKLDALYADDAMAATFYNRALLAFTVKGPGPVATKALQLAIRHNPHVAALLLQEEEPPALDGPYILGSPEEALAYCERAWMVWTNMPTAVPWLRSVAKA